MLAERELKVAHAAQLAASMSHLVSSASHYLNGIIAAEHFADPETPRSRKSELATFEKTVYETSNISIDPLLAKPNSSFMTAETTDVSVVMVRKRFIIIGKHTA